MSASKYFAGWLLPVAGLLGVLAYGTRHLAKAIDRNTEALNQQRSRSLD